MARLYISNSRGRQQMLTGGRAPRLKEHKNDNRQEKPQKKRNGGAKYGAITRSKPHRRQIAVRTVTDDESTTSGGESADEGDAEDVDDDDDDDDDEDEEPEVSAPPQTFISHEAGRYQYDRSDDNLSEAGETESMFGGSYNPEQDEELENRLLDDNDEAYLAVDDISESDLDDDKIMEEQAKLMLADVTDDGFGGDSEDPSFYLNQIEGMSAYGFGDDSDGTIPFVGSSQDSESGNETLQRHVRFEETFPEERAFRGFSDSPTMSRALLPSALPDTLMQPLTGDNHDREDSEPIEETDSDLTDDDLPDAALDASICEEQDEEDFSTSTPLPKTLRPPPSGKFIDDGVQSAGILDSTGTVMLITNPQALGEEFARRYGASAPPSPGLDFAEAVFDTNSNSPETPNNRPLNLMPSGYNASIDMAESGHTPHVDETFLAANIADTNGFGALTHAFDDEGSMGSDLDDGEQLMRIEDIVSFDTESGEESPTSPVVEHDAFSSPGLPNLFNGNLMAFRRNADPTFRAMQHTSPIAPHAASLRASSRGTKTKKRKAKTDFPYSDAYYKGVTPVQRVSHPGNDLPMPASSPTKRRRMN